MWPSGRSACRETHAASVHVLIFVHENVVILILQVFTDGTISFQQLHRETDEIAEVNAAFLSLQRLVFGVDAGNFDTSFGGLALLIRYSPPAHRLGQIGVLGRVDHLVFRPRDRCQHIGDDLRGVVEIAVVTETQSRELVLKELGCFRTVHQPWVPG